MWNEPKYEPKTKPFSGSKPIVDAEVTECH